MTITMTITMTSETFLNAQKEDHRSLPRFVLLTPPQVEIRTKKLGKIKDKYKEKVAEIHDLTEEFQVKCVTF